MILIIFTRYYFILTRFISCSSIYLTLLYFQATLLWERKFAQILPVNYNACTNLSKSFCLLLRRKCNFSYQLILRCCYNVIVFHMEYDNIQIFSKYQLTVLFERFGIWKLSFDLLFVMILWKHCVPKWDYTKYEGTFLVTS